jgi:carbon monoxide dehydrogenase subunit G
MELQGSRLMPAPPTAVWAALNDAAVLQRCIPGCEEVQQLSEPERSARVAVKLGPVRARFAGKVMLRDVRPDEGCTLVFEGSGGAAGFARGESVVTLEREGDGTQVGYTVTASVGGKLGQVGGRMIDSAARSMADDFFEALAREWQAVEAPAAQPPAPHLPEPAAAAAPKAPVAPAEAPSLEALRVKWFLLGAAATGFGVLLARWLG